MSDQGYEPTRVDQPAVQTGAVGTPPPTPPGGRPPGEPPPPADKRPWIIGGLVALIVIAAIVLLLLAGDDDDDVATDLSTTTSSSTTAPVVTTTSTSSTTTTAPPPTTAAPTTAAPTTAAPPVTINPAQCLAAGNDADDPETAAQTVYDAWLRGDEDCARELMTPTARNQLFSLSPQPRELQAPCTEQLGPPPFTDCAFFAPDAGAIHFVMRFPDDHWEVQEIEQSEG